MALKKWQPVRSTLFQGAAITIVAVLVVLIFWPITEAWLDPCEARCRTLLCCGAEVDKCIRRCRSGTGISEGFSDTPAYDPNKFDVRRMAVKVIGKVRAAHGLFKKIISYPVHSATNFDRVPGIP